MAYRITTATDNDTATYADLESATAAVATLMGWDQVIMSNWYKVALDADGGWTEACSCYATAAECDADEEGAWAPRIVEKRSW